MPKERSEMPINIDFYAMNFRTEMEKLDKNAQVLIFCRSGGRSGKTLINMKDWGFKNVVELRHGYSGYN